VSAPPGVYVTETLGVVCGGRVHGLRIGSPAAVETPAPPTLDQEVARVGRALATLEAGVRQRLAELASLAPDDDEATLRVAELRSRAHLEEPTPVSPRPFLGRFLVLLRKATRKVFLKWYLLPILEQQTGFNLGAARQLAEQAEALRELRRRFERLEARLAATAAMRGADSGGQS